MPWADVAVLAYALLAAALAFAHSSEWPSAADWSKGHAWLIAQFVVFALLALTQLVVLVSARRSQRSKKLEEACQLVAGYVDDHCPEVKLRHVGIHVWVVAGPPFARYLRRSGSFLLAGERERSGIVWVKGKGVVGEVWEEGVPVTRDIDAIRARAASRDAYESLGREDKMGLDWEEFNRTPAYRAVAGIPLYRRAGSGSGIRAVLAVDLLEPGHFRELESAVRDPAFAYVIGVCESAL
jgi:hypothetical protein